MRIVPLLLAALLAAAAHAAPAPSPVVRYLDSVVALCDRAVTNIPRFTAEAEVIAARHLAGGTFIAWWDNPCLGSEILGRSGGFVNMGEGRTWSKDRTPAERSNDVVFLGFDRLPWEKDVARARREMARGCRIVVFGPAGHPDLAALAAAGAVVFDSGYKAEEVSMNPSANALQAWMLQAEVVAALTRRGRMPAMWKSYSYPDGGEWGSRYLFKKQFHDEFKVPPQPAGALAKAYAGCIRERVQALRDGQAGNLEKAAALIRKELAEGRRTWTAWAGHMPEFYVGLRGDKAWSQPIQLHIQLEAQRKEFRDRVPDGALVLRLGYHGMEPEARGLFEEKRSRVIFLAGEHPDPSWALWEGNALNIPLGWAFGDACVPVEGYPIRLFPPSGILQAVAYEAIHAAVMAGGEGGAE